MSKGARIKTKHRMERAKELGRVRSCEGCMGCDGSKPCMWKQGLLGRQDRPDDLGVSLRHTVVGDVPMIAVLEHRVGALKEPRVVKVALDATAICPVARIDRGGVVQGLAGDPKDVAKLRKALHT